MIKGKEALMKLLDGKVLLCGFPLFDERAYRYNQETNEVEYSNDKKLWKVSGISANEFLSGEWRE